MALPGEGDEGGHLDTEEEEVPQPMSRILEDLESREAMEPVVRHHFTSDQEVHSLRSQGKGLRSTSLPRLFCECPYK
nr:putative golgin subfamily A member 8F/8G [Macaca nemestrina]